MKTFLYVLGQMVFFMAAAPFVSGLVSWIKNRIRMRQGPGPLQPYYNLMKLFAKEETVSETASWIFRLAPAVVLAAVLTASLFVPVFRSEGLLALGDFLVLVFVFTLARFFLSLAALDTGSSFTGMGSSREMFISSLVEPVVCLVIFSVGLSYSSTAVSAFAGVHAVSVSGLAAAGSLFMAILAETSRIPVDNQETHLELTMVHEAMVLEYSGRSLALIEGASHVKQLIWFFLLAQIILPIGFPGSHGVSFASWFLWFMVRIMIIAGSIAVVEVSIAKMRLLRVADFLGFAFILGMIALVCSALGV